MGEREHGPRPITLSNAVYMQRPEAVIADAAKLSGQLGRQVNVELYARQRDIPDVFRPVARKKGIDHITPVTYNLIQPELVKYPDVKVRRIDGPFVFDLHDGLARWSGEKGEIRHLMWLHVFGTGSDMYAERFAKQISDYQRMQDKQKTELAISFHPNVWQGFIENGFVDYIRQTGLKLEIESAGRDKSSKLDADHLSDPLLVARMSAENGFDGMVLGLDHAIAEGLPMEDIMQTEPVRLHTAGIHTDPNHIDLILAGRREIEAAYRATLRANFSRNPDVVIESRQLNFDLLDPEVRNERLFQAVFGIEQLQK